MTCLVTADITHTFSRDPSTAIQELDDFVSAATHNQPTGVLRTRSLQFKHVCPPGAA